MRNENIWLTQAKIAELFGVERSVATKHLKNIFQEGELDKNLTCAKIAQVQIEGQGHVVRDSDEPLAGKGICYFFKQESNRRQSQKNSERDDELGS